MTIEHLGRGGYGGGITILKDYLQKMRPLIVTSAPELAPKRPGSGTDPVSAV